MSNGPGDQPFERRRAKFGPVLDMAARRYALDPALLRAVAYTESRFNPLAIGPVCGKNDERARGLCQLMPDVCHDLGVTDAHDPMQGANAAAKLLARHLAHYDGDEARALAAYNWGRGNVDRVPLTSQLPAQVRTYVARVLARKVIEAG